MTEWQRSDVVLDDSGNLFCYHNRHGWFGLASNQTSARGRFEWDELAHPVRPVFRLNPRPRMAACEWTV